MEQEPRVRRINRRSLLASTFLLSMLLALFLMPNTQLAGPGTERIANGGFEGTFQRMPFGEVGVGWQWFHNGGAADYGFYRDSWAPVVHEGGSSQLIEINTYGMGARDADRYAGIYQTVAVVPGQKYVLSVCGMLRALEDDPDRTTYGYRVQYGIDYNGGAEWRLVDNWVEIPWDMVYPRLSPGAMDRFTTYVTATSPRMTVFIRAWKKWGSADRELDVNLDSISLQGAIPSENSSVSGASSFLVAVEAPEFPVAGEPYPVTVQASNHVGVNALELYANGVLVEGARYEVGVLSVAKEFRWRPQQTGPYVLKAVAEDAYRARASEEIQVRVGRSTQYLQNGGFERGFRATPVGMVGQGWGWFHSGGRANYSFYDDTWKPVVYKGGHSQLVSISSDGWGESDNDRYAGIYQTVDGLTAGAEYILSAHGMLRGLAGDSDRNWLNYRLQWGYAPNGETDWRTVDNWTRVEWNDVYALTEPGSMAEYRAAFRAPSSKITLFFRVWKLWATVDREVYVNLDAISLVGYD